MNKTNFIKKSSDYIKKLYGKEYLENGYDYSVRINLDLINYNYLESIYLYSNDLKKKKLKEI